MGREGGGKRAANALPWRCELTAGRRGTSQRPPCDQVARDSSSALVSDLSERCICSLWPASRTGSTLCVRYHTILSWLIANSASVKAKQATLSTVGTEKQILQRRHATRLSRLQYSLAHLLLTMYLYSCGDILRIKTHIIPGRRPVPEIFGHAPAAANSQRWFLEPRSNQMQSIQSPVGSHAD